MQLMSFTKLILVGSDKVISFKALYGLTQLHLQLKFTVKWASQLECIISCCGVDRGSVNLGWFEKTTSQMRM